MIAIVDDDSEMRAALCDLLLVEGLACRAFASAEAFLAAHAPGAFVSVVTDLRMPGMTGLELLARIKRSEPDLPVIVVTSAIDAQTRQRAMDGGARAFLVKPIRDADLLSHLASILG
ncbi:response regulator transcription factor [Phenylobacterium sp. LjRoot225]|uniref:response regulator transcription factor n=1 Tax=Phenylobacterium sp. LjRoot225 TaxID=3342285 RepID=UPI003F509710